jgi:adenylyl-sulfate kinase
MSNNNTNPEPVNQIASSSNIRWETGALTQTQREVLNGHKAAVIWFTGWSGSGKTTIAKALELRLFRTKRCHTIFLDGDNLRHGLNGNLGFSKEDRIENIRRTAEVAKLGCAHGNIVLCSFISPYAKDRAFCRNLMIAQAFIEVYVKCDKEVLIHDRDPKGLYAKAIAGDIPNFTGISAPYEVPENPELVVESDKETVDEIVDKLMALLESRRLLSV